MARRSMSPSTFFAWLASVLLLLTLSACGGASEYAVEDADYGGTPYVLLEGPTPTVPPTVTRPVPTSEVDSAFATPISATPTSAALALPESEAPADIITLMERALTREGSVYHATIEQVIEGMAAGGTPRWTGELWLGMVGNVGRSEVRPDPEAPDDIAWMDPGDALRASSAVFAGNESYVAVEGMPISHGANEPCLHMNEFSLVAYLICRSPISPWTSRYSIYSHDELMLAHDREFNGRPALALSYGESATTFLYLDAETYLPLGWESNMMDMGTFVTTFDAEFVEVGALDVNLFEPASIGYVEPPAAAGKLLFVNGDGENWDIFTINPDGSGETNLTDHPGVNSDASWSPDGSKIAFASDRDGRPEIYVMNADGSGPTNVTNNPAADVQPAWSPDGGKILFLSDRDEQFMFHLYVMDAGGANVHRVSSRAGVQDPAWSFDGSRIAFTSNPEGNPELYVINADGTGEIHLADGSGGFGPQWASDDSRIFFSSLIVDSFEIMTVQPDGSGLTNLTNSPENEFLLSLSPDGTRIVFLTEADNSAVSQDIYAMNVDGSGRIRLAASLEPPVCYTSCAWSPDGTYFTYSVVSPGDGDAALVAGSTPQTGETVMFPSGIYLVTADGLVVTRLTSTTAFSLDWGP